jgi:hypothetical protein
LCLALSKRLLLDLSLVGMYSLSEKRPGVLASYEWELVRRYTSLIVAVFIHCVDRGRGRGAPKVNMRT